MRDLILNIKLDKFQPPDRPLLLLKMRPQHTNPLKLQSKYFLLHKVDLNIFLSNLSHHLSDLAFQLIGQFILLSRYVMVLLVGQCGQLLFELDDVTGQGDDLLFCLVLL
jgi:hypothetical protein